MPGKGMPFQVSLVQEGFKYTDQLSRLFLHKHFWQRLMQGRKTRRS